MEWKTLLYNHFLWGLFIGLLIWLYTVIKYHLKIQGLKRSKNSEIVALRSELAKLRQHIQTQLDIEAEKKEEQKKLIEDLKSENDNLRVTVQTLRQKPRREDLILLQVYDRAIHIMLERAPGFGPTWENTLKEAKIDIDKANKGIIPFIKRVIHPSAHPVIVSKNIKENKKLLSNSFE